MTTPAHKRLATAQDALLRALLANNPAPPGFDPARLEIQAQALLAKRRRVIARLEPDTCAELDDRFPAMFAAYAHQNPKPAGVSAQEDARAFTAWARRHARRSWRSRLPIRRHPR